MSIQRDLVTLRLRELMYKYCKHYDTEAWPARDAYTISDNKKLRYFSCAPFKESQIRCGICYPDVVEVQCLSIEKVEKILERDFPI
jgi:hypothetical protein